MQVYGDGVIRIAVILDRSVCAIVPPLTFAKRRVRRRNIHFTRAAGRKVLRQIRYEVFKLIYTQSSRRHTRA